MQQASIGTGRLTPKISSSPRHIKDVSVGGNVRSRSGVLGTILEHLIGSIGGAAGLSLEAWPIGAVFTSVVSTDPNTLLGYGTWASMGAGSVLVGLDSGDTDFDTVEETGGSKTVSHTNNHSGTAVTAHGTYSHGSDGSHAHDAHTTTAVQSGAGTTVVNGPASHSSDGGHIHDAHPTQAHTVTQPTAHGDHSVVQPYVVVYFWKRTA